MDPQSCQGCHPSQYKQWSGSMHAYASEDPVFLAMNRRAQKEDQLGDFCVNCHAPMAVRTGATEDGLNLDELPSHLKGVTCYFCHSVDAVEGSHNNPLRLAEDNSMRGAIREPVDNTAHLSSYSPLLDRDSTASSSLCGSCHDIVLDNKVHLERTFSEWQASFFGSGLGQTLNCGNCHMEGSSGLAAEYPGVKVREVHDHSMPGVDIALTPFPQQKEQRALVESEVKSGIIAQICVGPTLSTTPVTVVLENAFAGHGIPSGATQDRRLWLQLQAFAKDELIFESGRVEPAQPAAEAEAADATMWLFREKALDASGKEVHMFWRAEKLEPNLLKAPSSLNDQEHQRKRLYEVPLNDGIPDRVVVKMFMRPMGLEILNELSDTGYLDPSVATAIPTFVALDPVEWTPAKLGEGKKTGCFPQDPFER